MIWFRYVVVKMMSLFIKCYMILSSKKLRLGYGTRILNRSKFEGYNKVERFSVFGGEMGRCSYIGGNSLVIGKIGRYCSIGNNVNFITATHPTKKFVSTHPVFYSTRKQSGITYARKQEFDESPNYPGEDYSIIVGNDVYIGFGATIIGPVKIGDGAVIAANSTVVSDVAPYSIVTGVPAKERRKRFSDEQINLLLKFQWWNKDEKWLVENQILFNNIEDFIHQLNIKEDKTIE